MLLYKSGMTITLAAAILLIAASVSAHCDRLDGPVATDARRALETGDFIAVGAWVEPGQTDELRAAFEQTRTVRTQSEAARDLADRWFIETAVRLHREAEGMPYTGLKPAGQPESPDVAAADRAYETGDVEPVVTLLHEAIDGHVRNLFEQASHTRQHDAGSLESGRERVDAYIRFLIYVHGLYDQINAGPEHGLGETGSAAHAD